MPERIELTWVAKLKQWRKRRKINGKPKDFYLGSGRGKYDRVSYEKALAKWRVLEKDLETEKRNHEWSLQYAALRELSAPRSSVEPTVSSDPQPMPPQPQRVSASIQRWLDGTARLGEDRFGRLDAKTGAKGLNETLATHIDAYVAHQEGRYKTGERSENAPRRDRISAVRFMSYRTNAGLIKAEWGEQPLPIDEATLSRLMNQFRDGQQRLMSDQKIAPGTVNERIKTMRHIVNWLYKRYLIPSLPRDRDDLFAMHFVAPSARAMSLDIIHRVWNESSPRFKCFLAIALNCGFYAVDIAYLEHSHIQDGHIVCNRHKTGVPMRFKLWEITKTLLASECNGPSRLAFKSRKGGCLMIVDPAEGKHGKRWCEIDSDLAAIKKRSKIKPLSFSMFRDTSSTKVESIDRSVTDLFNGHADRRMARFYVDRASLDQDRMFAALDRAIDELESYYALKLN